jgi:D-3-phosphoglycerate dehydrogenase
VQSSNSAFESVTLDEVFSSSDIVSVHLPVNSETNGMIDEKCFSIMKSDSIFVNTARAAVVDRNALYEALSSGKIAGAYLDVFDHEPPDELDYKIIGLPNVFATPHIAGATHEVEDHHVRIMNKTLKEEHGIIVKK